MRQFLVWVGLVWSQLAIEGGDGRKADTNLWIRAKKLYTAPRQPLNLPLLVQRNKGGEVCQRFSLNMDQFVRNCARMQ